MKTLDAKSIERATRYSKMRMDSIILTAKKLQEDPNREFRIKSMECKACFYKGEGAIAGQAFTSYNCENCNSEQRHHNTNHPKYCKNCSEEHDACCYCGARVEV